MFDWHIVSTAQTLAPVPEAVRTWAETIEHIVVAIASIVAGLWALLRLVRERGFDSALTIDVESSTIPAEPHPYTFLDVTLTNVGKVELQAKPVRHGSTAYEDKPGQPISNGNLIVYEKLIYPCSLMLKKLTRKVHHHRIDWFDQTNFDPDSPGEMNLLPEYDDPNTNIVDFWMEPGETYHLGVPLVLSPGTYLAKVTFVGARSDKEFWSRLAIVSVPPHNLGAGGTTAHAEPASESTRPSHR